MLRRIWILLEQYKENLAIAMDTLRVAKLRSALTILGVVIGVATVMTMASLVEGLRSQIIWQQHIWTAERGGDSWRPMKSRGSDTANHKDHVHLTTFGNAGSL